MTLADSYLKRVALWRDNARAVSVTFSEVQFESDGRERPVTAVVNQHVNYQFALHGLSVWGPGAMVQVTFGARNEVAEVLKFWPAVRRDRERVKLLEPAACTASRGSSPPRNWKG